MSDPTPPPAPGAIARNEPEPPLTLTAAEWDFLTAATDTLIPADELTPAASECGVVTFIDRQLAGAWGQGARMYRGAPHQPGKPEQGYQLPHTPREFFAAGIAAANEWSLKRFGQAFASLAPAEREAALRELEAGKVAFAELSGKHFFEALLQIAMEGFFADPSYGGNRNKVSWRMVGYPGLPARYGDLIEEYRNRRYVAEPQSIEDRS